jgi:hypothetical protein
MDYLSQFSKEPAKIVLWSESSFPQSYRQDEIKE